VTDDGNQSGMPDVFYKFVIPSGARSAESKDLLFSSHGRITYT